MFAQKRIEVPEVKLSGGKKITDGIWRPFASDKDGNCTVEVDGKAHEVTPKVFNIRKNLDGVSPALGGPEKMK